ncbi:MAG: hypothetical protein ABI628_11350 [Chloroflexota bacterium]
MTELLDRELGVEPLPETMAAFRWALAETVERSHQRAASIAFGGPSVLGPTETRSDRLVPTGARP